MRVSWAICLCMMLDVICCPFKCWSLDRHGAKDEKNTLDNGMGPKAAMGQHPVVAYRHAQARKDIGRNQ